jgi:hypothetical protein
VRNGWSKHISLKKARELSKNFCNDFNICQCGVYYVDNIFDEEEYCGNTINGIYCQVYPPHILLAKDKGYNRIGVLLHELTHHLEYQDYCTNENDPPHGYKYQLAKERVVTWARKNISEKCNWYLPLKSLLVNWEMKAFQL